MPKKQDTKKSAPKSKDAKGTKNLKKPSAKEQRKEAKKSVVDKAKLGTEGDKKLLELGLLLDCTGSMGSWIARAQKTLK